MNGETGSESIRRTRFTRALCCKLFGAGLLVVFAIINESLSTKSLKRYYSSAAIGLATVASDVVGTGRNEQINDSEEIVHGFLSSKEPTFFRFLQKKVDNMNDEERCKRYSFGYNASNPKKRRLFLGATIASEPWELFEIVGAEAYGIFSGIVFVESNRTQIFAYRPPLRLNHTERFQQIYGTDNVQVREFVNEDPKLLYLEREHAQRQEILYGWKELGMQPDDIGVLTDADETFTRDFYRAVQVCEVDLLDYEKNFCNTNTSGIRAHTMVYESSPECVTQHRRWYHPDMIQGHCLEVIGNESLHPKVPRVGYGMVSRNKDVSKYLNSIKDNRHPLSNAGDFRMWGRKQVAIKGHKYPEFEILSGYHFHNFFTNQEAMRFKYKTYGHPLKDAYNRSLGKMHEDIMMLVHCVRNESDATLRNYHRVEGGFNMTKPFQPIYFQDPEYRALRHLSLRDMVMNDYKIYNNKEITKLNKQIESLEMKLMRIKDYLENEKH